MSTTNYVSCKARRAILSTHGLKPILCRCLASKPVTQSEPVPSCVSLEDHQGALFRAVSGATWHKVESCCVPHPLLKHSSAWVSSEDAFRSNVSLQPLSGGNSNAAFLVTFTATPEPTDTRDDTVVPPLLLKVYGSAMQSIVDRDADTSGSMAAASISLGPGIVALFDWGRIEVFLSGYQNLTTPLLTTDKEPWNLQAVAAALRTLHTVSPLQGPSRSSPPALDEHLSRFLRCIETNSGTAAADDAIVGGFFADCAAEKDWLLQTCEQLGDPLVFGHNDANPSNLLWKIVDSASTSPSSAPLRPEGSVVRVPIGLECLSEPNRTTSAVMSRELEVYLIDYEFSGWNFPCFDLGNVVCELDYDYEQSHGVATVDPVTFLKEENSSNWKSAAASPYHGFVKPLAEQQLLAEQTEGYHEPHLAKRILAHMRLSSSSNGGKDTLAAHIVSNFISPYFNVPSSDLSVDVHFRRLALGMLASHLKWGLWGCAVCLHDGSHDATQRSGDGVGVVYLPRGSSGLDYAAYAECRLREYHALKRWLLDEGLV